MAKGNFLRSDYYNYINSNMDLLAELSQQGNVSAQYIYGVLLLKEYPLNEHNIESKTTKIAISCLEKAAKKQNLDAILELIYIYKEILKLVTSKKEKDIYNNKVFELEDLLKIQIKFINTQLENINKGIDPYHTRFPKPITKDQIQYINDAKDLNDFTIKLNELCKDLQLEEKEIISEETMYQCKDIVDYTIPYTVEDVLLYCASLNVLNTFVKQKQNKISYYFKNNVIDVLVRSIIRNNIPDVTYDITYDRGLTICYIKVYGIIFSFHQVIIPNNLQNEILSYSGHQKVIFDDVRKQKLAATIYFNITNYLNK